VWCFNRSGLPVYNLTIWCYTAFGRVPADYAVKAPDINPFVTERLRESALAASNNLVVLEGLEPAERRMVSPIPDWIAMYREGRLRVAIRFLDAEGRWWLRNRLGQLQETTAAGEP
jgi:hypothetical protein